MRGSIAGNTTPAARQKAIRQSEPHHSDRRLQRICTVCRH
nr:MAG TPA: hypothetical protein [Caudoviricetes sp.]